MSREPSTSTRPFVGPVAPIVLKAEDLILAPASLCWDLIARARNAFREYGTPVYTEGSTLGGSSSDSFCTEVKTKTFGTWLEVPSTWIQEQFYGTLRVYSKGPLLRGEVHMTLQPADGGKHAYMRLVLTVWPRTHLSRLLSSTTVLHKFLPNFLAFVHRVAAERVASRNSDYAAAAMVAAVESGGDAAKAVPMRVEPVRPLSKSALAVEQCGATLRASVQLSSPSLRPVAERLIAFLRDGFSDEVTDIRPFALADLWHVPRAQLLEACFMGVGVMLMQTHWVLLCPCCARKTLFASMAMIPTSSLHCVICRKSIATDVDEALELRFSVSPLVRPAQAVAVFSPADPSEAPFALYQERFMRSSMRRSLDLVLQNESYVVRDLISHAEVRLLPFGQRPRSLAKLLPPKKSLASMLALRELAQRAPPVPLEPFDPEAVIVIDMATATVPKGSAAYIPGIESGTIRTCYFAPGRVSKLQIISNSSALIRLERSSWHSGGLRPSHVVGLPLFRSLWPAEMLRPGKRLKVSRICFAVFDLAGGKGSDSRRSVDSVGSVDSDGSRLAEALRHELWSRGGLEAFDGRVLAAADTAAGFIPEKEVGGLDAAGRGGDWADHGGERYDSENSSLGLTSPVSPGGPAAAPPLLAAAFSELDDAGVVARVLDTCSALSADQRGLLRVGVAAGSAALISHGSALAFASASLFAAALGLARTALRSPARGAALQPAVAVVLAGDVAIDKGVRELVRARDLALESPTESADEAEAVLWSVPSA